MKDMIVNCIGAVIFSVIGYFYIIGRSKSGFARNFIPRMKTEEEISEEEQQIDEFRAEVRARRNEKRVDRRSKKKRG